VLKELAASKLRWNERELAMAIADGRIEEIGHGTRE
jgi:hypothetical protein